ncbi:hypothetical protein COU76_02485, partial [Candidatus Peregrinibacteria bacterium CG10_big_fil_rev_8_21_14_0_10_49_10]
HTDKTATPTDAATDTQMRIGDMTEPSKKPPEKTPPEELASARALSGSGDSGDVNYDPSLPF